MNNIGVFATNRMQISIRPIALGVLLAFSATAVRAQPKTQQAPLRPSATAQSTAIDLTFHPTAARQATATVAPTASAATSATAVPTTTSTPAASTTAVHPSLPSASAELQRVARWVTDSGNNAGLPYVLVDKVNARVFAFNPAGQLLGTAPALLGLARGDRMLAANDTQMSEMTPQLRITPAGRFVSRLAIDSHGKELLVLDYDASISLHAVVKGTPEEHRAERLNSATTQDNRISFGCINVPTAFYETVISPTFARTKGIVYVLPETGPADALFGFNPGSASMSGAQQGSTVSNARTVQSAQAPGSN